MAFIFLLRLVLGSLVTVSCQAIAAPRLQLPPLTKYDAWASHSLSGWLPFLHRPADSQLAMFVEWVFRLARVQDVPSLYSVMVKSWLTLSPLGSRGATRQPLPLLVILGLPLGSDGWSLSGRAQAQTVASLVPTALEDFPIRTSGRHCVC